jgi:predicted HAD superfamily Cof-like phosphohydrolase
MNNEYNLVKEFHTTFSHPVADKPAFMGFKRRGQRAEWMKEEIQEFIAADTLFDQVDAMLDLMYFALGTMVEMGVPPQKMFEMVHAANMRKLHNGKVVYSETGKVVKPEGWYGPEAEIQQELIRLENNDPYNA